MAFIAFFILTGQHEFKDASDYTLFVHWFLGETIENLKTITCVPRKKDYHSSRIVIYTYKLLSLTYHGPGDNAEANDDILLDSKQKPDIAVDCSHRFQVSSKKKKRNSKGEHSEEMPRSDETIKEYKKSNTVFQLVIQTAHHAIREKNNTFGKYIIEQSSAVCSALHETTLRHDSSTARFTLAATPTNIVDFHKALDLVYPHEQSTYVSFSQLEIFSTLPKELKTELQQFERFLPSDYGHSSSASSTKKDPDNYMGLECSYETMSCKPSLEKTQNPMQGPTGGGPFNDFLCKGMQVLTVINLSVSFLFSVGEQGPPAINPALDEFPFVDVAESSFQTLTYTPLLPNGNSKIDIFSNENNEICAHSFNDLLLKFLVHTLCVYNNNDQEFYRNYGVTASQISTDGISNLSIGCFLLKIMDALTYIFDDKVF